MRIAAPAVNPTMTGWDTKFTSTPSRAMPSVNWITPTIRVRVIALATYSALPGTASALSEENSTMEAAVVGPETSRREDPNSAATMAGTIAA